MRQFLRTAVGAVPACLLLTNYQPVCPIISGTPGINAAYASAAGMD
jgi:hypothetical protein